MFGTFDVRLGPVLLGPEPPVEAAELSSRIRRARTDFATSGDPGRPRYDGRQRMVQVFDAPSEVAVHPEEASRRLWQDHTFSPLPLSGA